jgi:hypothetical protein
LVGRNGRLSACFHTHPKQMECHIKAGGLGCKQASDVPGPLNSAVAELKLQIFNSGKPELNAEPGAHTP